MNKAEFVRRVRNCERRLYRVARTMLSSDADCEDAVQEALLKAWSQLDTLREEAYFETWLIRILINECRSLWRRRRGGEAELPENLTQAAADDASPVFDALMALPEKHRIALELRYVEGYRTREIAKLLGISESAVKWRLGKGRELLKKELGEEVRA